LLHKGKRTKFYDLFFAAFQNASRIVLLGGTFLAAVFVQQRYPAWIEPLTGSSFENIAQSFPQLPEFSWILILTATLYIHRSLKVAGRRLSEREVVTQPRLT
jgi:hypothetical protein